MVNINYDKICFYDTETVSISPNYIISLAYIAYEKGKLIDKGYIVCNPDYEINEKASLVNGFTNDMVKDKPLFDKQWENIKKYFEDGIWCGHNVQFDERAIRTESLRYDFDIPSHGTCCTLKNAKKFIPKAKIKDYKLITLCDYFNIKFIGEAHNSFYDTLMCMKVFNKLLELSGGELLIDLHK